MSKKIRIFVSAIAIAGVLVLGGIAIGQYDRAETYSKMMTATYRHAFSELAGGVNNISAGLQKSLYASSPAMISSVCTEIYGEAKSARMIMGELPFYGELEKTASFLTNVGDYAFMLSKSAASGESYTDEQYENMKQLSQVAEVLSYNLTQLMYEIDNGSVTLSALKSADNAAEGALSESMKTVESEFPEVPSLIYDGPFSEHIQTMKPVYLEGTEEVSEESAKKALSGLLEISADKIVCSGIRGGNLPVYMLESETEYGGIYAEVSVQGGIVIEIMVSRNIENAELSQENAVEIARTFLEKAGFDNMTESYYMTNGNVCTVNFAYMQEDTVCYPDLVKVSVALDNGQVTGFETTGYVMSHTERDLAEIRITEDEAREKVSKELEILSHGMAVIPTDGKYEVLCHEFKCETEDEQHCIVYVNAANGKEEKILILIENESGTLTK